MYPTEGSRMNYYVPIQDADETSPCKKKKCNNISSEPRRAVRILGRRYALTPTSYKYLDIGINVGAVSCVELVLGDNRGNQIILPFETWKALIQKCGDIERLLQSTEIPLRIRDLTFEVVKISDSNIIKIGLSNNSLYMKPPTLFYLFDFEKCIDHMYYWLCENTHIVNEKFKQFVTVLQQNNIANVCDAAKTIHESDMFNSESLIDCELLTCAVNDILHEACNK
ncbi:hypothetical protein ACS0PU_011630 [Formica fusca]